MKHKMKSGMCIDLSQVVVISSYNNAQHAFVIGMVGGRDLELQAIPQAARQGRDRNEIANAEAAFKQDYTLLSRAWMSFGQTSSPTEEDPPASIVDLSHAGRVKRLSEQDSESD